jgi:hypothetical protein
VQGLKSVSTVHSVALRSGTQVWQSATGFRSLSSRQVPSIRQAPAMSVHVRSVSSHVWHGRHDSIVPVQIPWRQTSAPRQNKPSSANDG